MSPKRIALGLFVAGLCLMIAAGLPQLRHIAAGWQPDSLKCKDSPVPASIRRASASNSKTAVRDLQTGQLTIPPAAQQQ